MWNHTHCQNIIKVQYGPTHCQNSIKVQYGPTYHTPKRSIYGKEKEKKGGKGKIIVDVYILYIYIYIITAESPWPHMSYAKTVQPPSASAVMYGDQMSHVIDT